MSCSEIKLNTINKCSADGFVAAIYYIDKKDLVFYNENGQQKVRMKRKYGKFTRQIYKA